MKPDTLTNLTDIVLALGLDDFRTALSSNTGSKLTQGPSEPDFGFSSDVTRLTIEVDGEQFEIQIRKV